MTTFITRAQALAKVGDRKTIDLKAIAKSFQSTMKDLLFQWADPDKDMQLNGMTVKAKDKYGVVGVYSFNKTISDLGTMYEGANKIYSLHFDEPKTVAKWF